MDREGVLMQANREGWEEEVQKAERGIDSLGMVGMSERDVELELMSEWHYSDRR